MRESAVAGQLGANGASSRSGPEWAPSGERHVDPRPAFSSPTPFLLAPPLVGVSCRTLCPAVVYHLHSVECPPGAKRPSGMPGGCVLGT